MSKQRNNKGKSDHGANNFRTKGDSQPSTPKLVKGDTGRSSNQGRKEASGGSKDTNNRGHQRGNQGEDTIGNP